MSSAVQIRAAEPADVELIFSWVVELAEYERAREHVTGSVALLSDALFGTSPSCEALIAEIKGRAVGFALFYRTFSTWEARPGIWLEDLYVPPVERRSGVGAALLQRLAEITVSRGFTRLEWSALHWNTPALDFYAKLGAKRLEEWRVHRLDGETLERVARGVS